MQYEAGRVPMRDPLALFLTWTTYGTWLPGDERGWVAKPGEQKAADARLERWARSRLTEPPLIFDEAQREIVEWTIADHCSVRGWYLHAVACRSNHVHVVVTAPGRDPEEVMDQFKAWCTRNLKRCDKDLNRPSRSNWWTQRGSKRRINDEAGLVTAIEYVREAQDRPRTED